MRIRFVQLQLSHRRRIGRRLGVLGHARGHRKSHPVALAPRRRGYAARGRIGTSVPAATGADAGVDAHSRGRREGRQRSWRRALTPSSLAAVLAATLAIIASLA